MGRRKPNLNRRSHVIEPKRRFIIFCEGKNTEPGYFNALGNQRGNALVKIQPIGGIGEPLTIAAQAVNHTKELRKSKNSYEKTDQVWAVFDRDVHLKYYEAIVLCENNHVSVGKSNPCFELWLILHIQDFDKPDDHKAVERFLSRLCPEYNPNGRKTLNYPRHLVQLEKAEHRAEAQLERRHADGDPRRPLKRPYTTVFRLTRAIRDASGTPN